MQSHPASYVRGLLNTICATFCATLAIAGIPRGTSAQEIRLWGDTTVGSSANTGSRTPSVFGARVITPDSIDLAPVTSFSDLLQARVPGLSVQPISGASGSAARIHLRGVRSATSSSTPLVIVDGIRVEAAAPHWVVFSGSSPSPGTEWTSRLDFIDPEDVESVEVLGGPATAARYGLGAANGVILVTTKRAARDGLRWAAHSSFATVSQATDFPGSYDQRGVDNISGEQIDYCGVIQQARHSCTAIPGALLSSNALELHSPFRTGTRSQLGLDGSAGNDHASIYLSGDFTRENGTLAYNYLRGNHVLANGSIRPFSGLEIGARAGYTRGSIAGIAPGSEWSVISSGLEGRPDSAQGYRIAPDSLAETAKRRSTARFVAGGTATWRPIHWLSIAGSYGVDRDRWIDDQTPYTGQSGLLFRRRTNYSSDASTARAEATAAWKLGAGVDVASTIGIEKLKHEERGRDAALDIDGSTSSPQAYQEFRTPYRLNGKFGQLDLSWQDRISLTGGVRSDKIRGDAAKTYPWIGAAWQISNEPWFSRAGAMSTLRLRAAYGEIGQSRTPLDPTLFFTIRTPRASESELGVDLSGLDGRAALSLTYYRGRSHAWYADYNFWSPFEPSPPIHPQSVRSSGLEAALSATILETGSLSVHMDASAAFPRTRYEGTPRYVYAIDLASQRLTPGYPVAGYWAPPILGYEDRNPDHRIDTAGCLTREFPSASTCEVQLGEIAYLGSPIPTREFSLRPSVTRRRITLSALFDYRGGNKLFNVTAYVRCLEQLCRASQDALAPLADQARAVAAELGSPAGYIEDAGFWKFRELSLAVAAPETWAAKLGARRLGLTLAGRNLATWTKYGGPDPEVSSDGYESLSATDYFTQPAVRSFIMRLDIGW